MDIFGNFNSLPGDNKKRIAKKNEEIDFSYSDVTTEPIAKVEEKDPTFSVVATKTFLILVFFAIILRLFFMQVVYGSFSQNKATENSIKPRVVDAPRGIITDSNGDWLARNDPEFALAVYPCDLPKKKSDREEVYKKISEISGIGVDDIRNQSEKDGLLSLYAVYLRENIPHDEALVLEKKIAGVPGLVISKRSKREYATLPGLSHILGYTGMVSPEDLKKDPIDYFVSDKIGKTGLEYSYESYLRGKHGIEEVEKDSKGNVVRVLVQEQNEEPVMGDSVSLYLDRGLQEETARALQASIDKAKTDLNDPSLNAGVAIVMDVNTGGILSMVSLPDYNNNLFSTKISNTDYQALIGDQSNPMLNRAIAGIYPPGSISKIIMASAGLAEGTITPATSLVTPAAIKIGEYSFPDWKDHSYESTNVERAIAESNDIFFYALGGGFDKIAGMGIDKIKKWWQRFGLGEKTGIDLPGEASGLLPDNAWKKKVKNEQWYLGDTYHVSIGQGDMLVTPIQMLRATAAIANGGKLLQPQLVKKITDSDGSVVKEFGPRVEAENIVSPDVIKTVQQGMRMTITEGSARSVFPDFPVEVAGKTGTAQFLNNAKTHAWFECYAPYDSPQIAVIAMVEGGGEGFDVAGPVAKGILQYYFQSHPVN